MIRIAVVEDNADLLDDVVFHLERAGYRVAGYPHGAALDADLAGLAPFDPQLLVLDLGLPGEDGLAIARRLRRARPPLGIVMLTARTALDDRIAGHDSGADNYLCKPVEMEELIAVVGARARRLVPTDERRGEGAAGAAAWRYLVARHTLIAPAGEEIELTASEATLIRLLAAADGQQASRNQLVAALGQDHITYDYRRLEAIVSRLRRKLDRHAAPARPLRALRNQGYVFLEPLTLV